MGLRVDWLAVRIVGHRPIILSIVWIALSVTSANAQEKPSGAYVVRPASPAVIDALRAEKIPLEELREDCELSGEVYELGQTVSTPATAREKVSAGSLLVRQSPSTARLLAPDAVSSFASKPVRVMRLTVAPTALVGPAPAATKDRPAKKPITVDVMLASRGLGGGPGITVEWLADGEHFLQTKQGKLYKVHARSGRAEAFVDPDKLRKSLAALSDLAPTAVDQIVKSPSYRMNHPRTATLVNVGQDLALAHFDGSPAVRLTRSASGKESISFSPGDKSIAFTRSGNLFAVDLATQAETALTADGGGEVLNGHADWVYEEELFHRNGRAYWWSPDGTAVVFLRLDDKPVPKFAVAAAFPNEGQLETISYPKAGAANPFVKIGVAHVAGGAVRYLDLPGYPPDSTLVSRVGWVGKTNTVFAYVQNREQTWLDFVTWPDPAAAPVKLFRETTKAWVEDLGEPHFLADGSFLILSERTGWKHVYHYAADGKLIRAVTGGEWVVQSIERIDEAAGWVYFTGTKDGPARTHLYRTLLDGPAVERITGPATTTHRITLAPKGSLFVDRFSDDTTPPRTSLFEIGGAAVRVLDSNPGRDVEQYTFGRYERTTITTKDEFVLEAAVTYPPDFDPKAKYPIWVLTYAGPHAPTVHDGWAPRLLEQTLAHSGIVVLRVDPRSASGKGAQSAWACYKHLGVQELKDLEEAVDWICKNSWADSSRVGISGHSYGGYISAYALTHSKKFAAAIAGAPVTDWRLYDSIYTERYMGLPKDNKEGYDKSSVVKAAANLHGKLLIVHGLIDDNVHFQNSAQLIDALERAGKDFEVMIYPRYRHGIVDPHYPRLQVKFIQRTMGVK
ncbi:S9 family peptidase [Fimbriiglobus ruber]|uniref:Dipeptidyl peptidase IV n=1 Tax=Fimbriiglobus ruber TaxID=1908690 RepID=A0A225DSA6_9BACT|nr:DPP IV N-terminal domain-containing protein [Fimbriiglobus ruber]OWK44340.1 Dipeptidyl peptidase IV [Fimbriiglobus ruber]